MKMSLAFYLVALLCLISLIQCNKPPVIPKSPTVYVVGESQSDPDGLNNVLSGILWVDGKPSVLSKGPYIHTYTRSVYVSGKDVYIAGTSDNDINTKATLWKNGIPEYLNSSTGNTFGCQVAVASNNVYVLGTNTGYDWRTIVWKNGVASYSYNDLAGETAGMFIKGNDVYVAGVFKSSGKGLAAVYKNNDLTLLPLPENYTIVDFVSIFVNASDVYVTCTIRNNNRFKAVLWKNGQLSYLDAAYNSFGLKIHGTDTDIYIVGQIQFEDQSFKSLVWKNGQRMYLTNDPNIGFYSLFAFGKDIYLAGGDFSTMPSKALVFKNSGATYLASAPSLNMLCYANDVFVTQ